MSEPTPQISLQIQEQMEMICRRATAGGDDARHIRAELYGHLEDKLLAYLRGDERLTEADAMILVREHFGKPESLRAMLSDLHHAEQTTNQPPLARKLLVLCLITAVTEFVVFTFNSIFPILFTFFAARNGEVQSWALVTWNYSVSFVINGVATYATYRFIRKARRGEEPAGRLSVMHWRAATVVALILSIIALRFIMTAIGSNFALQTRIVGPWSASPTLVMFFVATSWSTLIFVAVRCVLWLNWASSNAVFVWRSAAAATATWVVYHASFKAMTMLLQHVLFPRNVLNLSTWMLEDFVVAILAICLFAGFDLFRKFQDRIRVRYA